MFYIFIPTLKLVKMSKWVKWFFLWIGQRNDDLFNKSQKINNINCFFSKKDNTRGGWYVWKTTNEPKHTAYPHIADIAQEQTHKAMMSSDLI